MIEVLTGNYVTLNYVSEQDRRLQGEIRMKNPFKDRHIVFKIKSTDIDAFEADRSKGFIKPNQTVVVPIMTSKESDAQYAKRLAQNKFLIQYVLFAVKPQTIQKALEQFKGSNVETFKVYVNTNNVRSSRIGKQAKEDSMVGSNRNTFRSMIGGDRPAKKMQIEYLDRNESNNQLEDLKTQIEGLQKQRARLRKDLQNSSKPQKKEGIIKYLIILIVGIIFGNLGGHYLGLDSAIKSNVSLGFGKKQVEVEEQQGFFSIFNLGFGQQKEEKKQKAWFNFL